MKTVKFVFVPIVVLLLVFLVTNVCDATPYNVGDIIVYSGRAGLLAVIYDGSDILEDIKEKIVRCIPVSDYRYEHYANLFKLDIVMDLNRRMSSLMQNNVNAINEENIDKEVENKAKETENIDREVENTQNIDREVEKQAIEQAIEKNKQAIEREIQVIKQALEKNEQARERERQVREKNKQAIEREIQDIETVNKQARERERQVRERERQVREKNKQGIEREIKVIGIEKQDIEGERQARERAIEKNNQAIRREKKAMDRERQNKESERINRERERLRY